MSNASITHSGVGDYHFRDVKFKKVRELMDMSESNAAYVAKHQDNPPDDYQDRVYEMRWERLKWMFANLICDADGLAIPDMDNAEAFENMGWNEMRDLEAAGTNFLFRETTVPAS